MLQALFAILAIFGWFGLLMLGLLASRALK
jgi:hypothetical protein